MLSRLYIKNYALIENLDINFNSGLSIITGETGAGKSILIGALSLILGQRADTRAVRQNTNKCVIEGVFDISDYDLNDFFKQNDLDYERLTILRREISASGKSRAFINDTPVTLNQLKLLGYSLVNIHSQHETLRLNDPEFQLAVIDSFAGINKELDQFREEYYSYRKNENELRQLKEQESTAQKDHDYLSFQLEELISANLNEEHELEKLEERSNTLEHAEEIRASLSGALDGLNMGDRNVSDGLHQVISMLSKYTAHNTELTKLVDRLRSCEIELNDIASELNSLEQEIIMDPETLTEINERLDLLNKLLQKHGMHSIGELIELRTALDVQIQQVDSLEEQITAKAKALENQKQKLLDLGKTISIQRNKIIPKLEKSIKDTLVFLGMPYSRLQVKADSMPSGQFRENGIDTITFLFTANKGSLPQPINKVASGGELSRLMLSIQSLVAEKLALPTIILDEIDTGISGDVADKAGEVMRRMAMQMQVVAITHLPQIAAKGEHHYKVYKSVEGDETVTSIISLKQDDRVNELAKMLSGTKLTEAAVENARELLGQKG